MNKPLKKYFTRSYLGYFLFVLAILLSIIILTNNKYSAVSQIDAKNSLPNWYYVKNFSRARRGLAAVSVDNHIYVIGGIDNTGRYVVDVEYSQIFPDGTLGQWRSTSPLPSGRVYISAQALNGYIFILGGGEGKLGDNNIPISSVLRAKILANGQLGTWQAQASLLTPRRGLQTVSKGGAIYAIGGYNGSFLQSVEQTQVSRSGEIIEWQNSGKQLRVERYIHSATIYRDKIYVLGGHMRNPRNMSYGDVESTRITNTGEIGNWYIEQSSLGIPRFIALSTAVNNHLYILGGHDGGRRLRSVEFASINPTGNIGQWRHAGTLNEARSAAAITTYGDFIYVLGGMGKSTTLNSVEVLHTQGEPQ